MDVSLRAPVSEMLVADCESIDILCAYGDARETVLVLVMLTG